MKIQIVIGTRPEIIKLSPVIRKCEQHGLEYFILHTGQHYSYTMDRIFFEELGLPNAKYNLEIGSGTHAEQTGKMLIGIEKVLCKEKPDVVLAEGDTNTVLAGALAAAKLGVAFGHVEAGLRSYDENMPEEINRVLADHCASLLFAPTPRAKRTLLNEGIARKKVFLTGNTIVEAVCENLEISKGKASVLEEQGVEKHGYFLVTVHRQENVDCKARFQGIMEGLKKVSREFGMPILYPIHPRAKKQLEVFDIKTSDVKLLEPLDYLNFLQLESNARLILTDSGGIQEEACILNIPCVTLRYNTERPETLDIGSNVLAGTDPSEVVRKTAFMLKRKNRWKNPFGDGKASEKILRILKDKFGTQSFRKS